MNFSDDILTKSEKKDMLLKYKRQLKRNLQTLAYISSIELDAETENNSVSEDILNLKNSVQRHIINLTEKINYYNALL